MTTRVSRTFVLSAIALALLTTGILIPQAVRAAHSDANSHQPHFFKSTYVQYSDAVPAASNNLTYNGGPVMAGTMQAYLIFWEPSGSYVSPSYNSLIQRYFNDVGGSGLYHNNTQYTDSSGNAPSNVTLAGTWVDTTPYPSTTLQDSDIQNEVSNALSTNGWAPAITNMFFVFTAKSENICDSGSCSFSQFCAYHNYFGTNTIYAAMPYAGTDLQGCGPLPAGSPNNDADADAEISTTSHEQMEAATDPLLSAWIDSGGQEIGDKCAYNYGQTASDGSNENWNGHPYIVQQEWDNAQSGCVQTGP
ncbi:MAG: hypothetical protein JO031_15410 [Ktedonobacteraceae bacterium]|nr:hypothetical protein [Ktedonobacteraceae bacterium]